MLPVHVHYVTIVEAQKTYRRHSILKIEGFSILSDCYLLLVALQLGVGFYCHLFTSTLGFIYFFCPTGVCSGLMHAVTVTASSCSLLCSVWKTHFPWCYQAPPALIVFLTPPPYRPPSLEGRTVIGTVHLSMPQSCIVCPLWWTQSYGDLSHAGNYRGWEFKRGSSHVVPVSHCLVCPTPPSSCFCSISASSSVMFPEPWMGFHRHGLCMDIQQSFIYSLCLDQLWVSTIITDHHSSFSDQSWQQC